MSKKNLYLKLNAKMLSANQIAGFLNFSISKNNWRCKVHFLHGGTYLLKLQIDHIILGGCGQAYPGMPKEVIKS